jgi:hypothetical protein
MFHNEMMEGFRWYNGRIRIDRKGSRWFYLAPLAKASVMAFLWLVLALAVPIYSLLALAAWELSDVLAWFKGYWLGDEKTDGMKWRMRHG